MASCAFGACGVCRAQVQLPSVNLGLTNFEDGLAGPGWFLQEFPDYYHADELKDSRGNAIPGSNHLTTFSTTTHVVYASDQHLFGAWPVFEVLQPWVNVDTRFANGAQQTSGFADVTVGAGLQWAPRKIGDGIFASRFILDVSLPTGRYNDRKAVNVGSNFVAVDPYYALTFESGKLEFSARLHYLWNSVNREPFLESGAHTTQAGQAFHVNYAVSYEVVHNLRLGFNGYWLQQLTDHKLNGVRITNSLERTIGLGAGLQWFLGNNIWVHLNGYRETDVRNRAQGSNFTLRFSKAIPSGAPSS